ncbi:predicted protein [Naegleria gruberi]|uniref:Predicted protein n=1 Tax=Naegleria gruberi TaxID=5762 RepID=D2VYM9_NAEGR|nr:uncharacterized protein NAEGRDRAFT_59605 [Naegleria gruberi]EFC38142.1 predicted protein [Naegleria gruberi]|eukprot:XP_002670886.1 predicted protein [Naegleria gruberi strain NEG-M]
MNLRRDRSKRYEFVLDCLPRWSVILILVLVLLIVGLFVIISLFASPEASVTVTRRHSSNGSTIVTTTNSLVEDYKFITEQDRDEVLELTIENTIVEDNSTNSTTTDTTTDGGNSTTTNGTDIVVDPINPAPNNGTTPDNGTIVVPPTYMEEIFTGKRSIIDTFDSISIYAMEFKYILKLNPVNGGKDLFGAAIKSDLKVRVHMYGRNSDSEDWTMVNNVDDSVSTHELICAQTGYLSILQSGGCSAITLFHSRVIRYSNYKMNLTILNLENVYRSGLLENAIETSLQSNNPQYSMYELGFRMTFSVLSILHWIAFLVVTFWSQQLRNWHTAQKWLVVLLFLHFWYHDPLYPAMMWTGWEGFPVVDIILSVTFVYGFLLYLLIFFHSVFKAPQDRTFMNFYLTKIIIVGIGYILTLILMIWSRVYNVANPSSVDISSVPGYAYLLAANIVFLVLWGIDLAYYIFRAMGAVGKLKAKYSSRFRVVGSFSFIVAACFIGLTIAGNGFRTDVQSLTFLLLHGIVYVYFASLSFLLMPGKNEERKPELSASAKEMDANDKSDFTKPSSANRVEDDDEVQITDVVLSRNDEDF